MFCVYVNIISFLFAYATSIEVHTVASCLIGATRQFPVASYFKFLPGHHLALFLAFMSEDDRQAKAARAKALVRSTYPRVLIIAADREPVAQEEAAEIC